MLAKVWLVWQQWQVLEALLELVLVGVEQSASVLGFWLEDSWLERGNRSRLLQPLDGKGVEPSEQLGLAYDCGEAAT